MSTLNEALSSGQTSPLASDLAAGVQNISAQQKITFTRYVRLVLPLDGYVFWVKAEQCTPSALYNVSVMNNRFLAFNSIPEVSQDARTLIAQGSLHYATDTRQEEDETYAANRVVFTSLQEVNELNYAGPNSIWIAEFDGVRFAFSARGSFYQQANLYHYVGMAVYPDMATQVVDDVRLGFDQRLIVSNSLPLWLALNNYVPFYGFGNPSLTLFPSFLTEQNLAPPFAAVHIDPETTKALGSAPLIGQDSTHSQLCSETVRITLWGTRNFSALDFVDCVLQRSRDYEEFGVLNMPVVQDQKRTQSELGTIAQKKTVTFEVSYIQNRVNQVARQIIGRALVDFVENPHG